jgi:glycosyltransferase involved in cell wall biosynthesis
MIALVIPTLNEGALIGAVVSAIPRDLVSRKIVADSGSSDATAGLAREAGAEVIEAVTAPAMRPQSRRKTRTFLSPWTATTLATSLLARGYGRRVRYTDMCAFRRDALLALGMREMTYGWNIEMQMRAAGAGLRILEIPVPYRCRSGGASKVAGNLSGSIKAAVRIVATFVRVSTQQRTAPTLAVRESS